MARQIKQVLLGLGILFGTIILLLVAVLFYLKTDHALRLIEAKVTEAIPGTVLMEKLRFSLFKGEFELENVLLKGSAHEELAGFDRLFIRVSWHPLLKGNLTVSELIIEKPRAALQINKEGNLTLIKALLPETGEERKAEVKAEERKKPGIPINIIIEQLRILNGLVSYETSAEGLRAAACEIDITADANLVQQSGNNEPLLDLTVDLAFSLPEVMKSLKIEQPMTGEIAARLSAQGSVNNPQLNLSLDYRGGSLFGNRIDEIDLDIKLKDRLININNLRVNVGSGDLNLQGEVDLRTAFVDGFLSPIRNLEEVSYKISLNQKEIKLENLLAGTSGFSGTVSSDISVCGKGISPQTLSATMALELSVEKLTADPSSTTIDAHLKAEGSIKQGIAKLEQLNGRAGDIKLRADGQFNISSNEIAAKLGFDAPDIGSTLSFFGIEKVSGEIKLKADVFGPIRRPEVDLVVEGDQLRFQDISIGSIQLNAGLDESGTLKVGNLSLKNNKSMFHASGVTQILEQGTIQPLKDPVFDFHLKGDPIFLEDFVNKLKGRVTLAAHLKGSLSQPGGFAGIHGAELDLGFQKLEELKLYSRINGEKISISPLQIMVTPKEMIEAAGWFTLQKGYQIAVKSEGISLSSIDRIRELKIAQGRVILDISGNGTLDDPQIKGEITIDDVRIYGNDLDDFEIHIDICNQVARISGKTNFDLNGFFDLEKKEVAATLIFDETDFTPYLKMAGHNNWGGMLTGKIEAAGNAREIDQIEAVLDCSKIDLFFKDKELVYARDFKVFFKDQEVSVPSLHLVLPEKGRIDIKGKGKPNGPVALEIEGKIPLYLASLFAEDVTYATGDILLCAGIRGTLPQPDILAEIGLEKIGFAVADFTQRLHDISGRLEITPQLITIDSIKGYLDTGSFDMTGEIGLKQYKPVNVLMAVNAHSLPLEIPAAIDMLINTNLKIEGTEEKSIIKGDLLILEGTYFKDVNLSFLDLIKRKKRKEALPPQEIKQPFLKNMGLDIYIKRRNPFLIENNLAQLDVNPDLHISGKLNNPIITGRARIESGTITYRKKTFIVKKGTIDFLSPYKIEPAIDIESEVQFRNWTIYLNISGTPDNLELKFTSNPYEEDGDILSLLLFGKTTRELIKEEGGGTSQSTAQMLAEMISATFGDDVKDATGLDILDVETQGDAGEQSNDRIKVTLGKELSRRMVIKYALESKNGEIGQRAIAEYKFLESIFLSGFQDSRGIFGGELQFRLEFR